MARTEITFQYRVLSDLGDKSIGDAEKILDELGRQGYELKCHPWGRLILMRRIVPPPLSVELPVVGSAH